MAVRKYVLSQLRSTLIKSGSPWQAVYPSRSLTTANLEKPYVVVHFGNDTEDYIAPSDFFPHQVYIVIYFHDVDEPVSYTRINEAIEQVKAAFRANPSSGPDKVIDAIVRETSQDMADPTLETVFRYLRVQLTEVETS